MSKNSRASASDAIDRFIIAWGSRGFNQDQLHDALSEAEVTYDQYVNWAYHSTPIHQEYLDCMRQYIKDCLPSEELRLIYRTIFNANQVSNPDQDLTIYRQIRPLLLK